MAWTERAPPLSLTVLYVQTNAGGLGWTSVTLLSYSCLLLISPENDGKVVAKLNQPFNSSDSKEFLNDWICRLLFFCTVYLRRLVKIPSRLESCRVIKPISIIWFVEIIASVHDTFRVGKRLDSLPTALWCFSKLDLSRRLPSPVLTRLLIYAVSCSCRFWADLFFSPSSLLQSSSLILSFTC